MSCVPRDIKGKTSALGKVIGKHKRGTQYTLCSNEGSNNMTLWYDGAPVLFADNDFDGSATADITGKIYSKKKKEFKGVRSYKANEAVRCYRHTHNNVDIHNQYISYGHWDYKSRRKQMRIPYQLIRISYLREIGFSLFDSFVLVNSFIAWRNHTLKGKPEKQRFWKKYGIRQGRLNLITRWAKRCSRHYPSQQPHRQKRLKIVNLISIDNSKIY